MQMRVALARALITNPKVLLLDEPFAALDEGTRFRLQDLLLELRAALDLQYIFVTHSITEAVYLGDRVLLMNKLGQIHVDRRIDSRRRPTADALSIHGAIWASVERQWSTGHCEQGVVRDQVVRFCLRGLGVMSADGR